MCIRDRLWGGDRGENVLDGGAPFYDTYECADGRYVAVGCVEPQFYAELLAMLEIDEVAEQLPSQLDMARWGELRDRLATSFKERTRDEWAELFADSDACVTPVLSPWEAAEHPHNRQRQAFVELDGLIQPAPAPRFGRTPAVAGRSGPAADPERILADWGIAPEREGELRSSGALG